MSEFGPKDDPDERIRLFARIAQGDLEAIVELYDCLPPEWWAETAEEARHVKRMKRPMQVTQTWHFSADGKVGDVDYESKRKLKPARRAG